MIAAALCVLAAAAIVITAPGVLSAWRHSNPRPRAHSHRSWPR
ncbi:putative membrane protein [Mycobacterium kansasii]|uniref:Putative membrane protein n=1 Tax=Mycobacterium kansasii TaxID=1768 RepID=A0A1V3X433_MYCKA|nr:putative membrane protein [Mycobacterium kansasii]